MPAEAASMWPVAQWSVERECTTLAEKPKPGLCYSPLIVATEKVTPMTKKGHICRETGKVFKVRFLGFFFKLQISMS